MKIISSIILFVIIAGCAQIVPLTGGKRDQTSPKVIAEKSSPQQGELNYSNPEMVLVFDEYIVLKNPINTISITPQPAVPPTITSKNKKLKLVFNEPLLPNTTYSVSFNGAITDLSEGNDSLFQYVFSTGSYIDSLQFSGSIVNGFTNKAEEGILVGLYPKNDTISMDSLPFKIKPTYITQSTASGDFNINYIKTGTYTAFAFSDLNRNLLFDPITEKIGFLDSIGCCNDSISKNNKFRLFEPAKLETGIKSTTLNYPGQLIIKFKEKEPIAFNLSHTAPLLKEITTNPDSVVFWLTENYSSKSYFVFQQGATVDTLKPILKNLPKNQDIMPLKVSNNLHEGKILPYDTLSFTFSEPFQITNKKLIKAYNKDSVEVELALFIKNIRTLQLLPLTDSAAYFQIDSAAIQSTLTKSSNGKLIGNFVKHPKTYFGQLLVTLQLDPGSAYILELLDLTGELQEQETIAQGSPTINFGNLLPNTYQLRLVKDSDTNGAWTTGDLVEKLQPETVYYYQKTIKVRSNWDMEIEWIVDDTIPVK